MNDDIALLAHSARGLNSMLAIYAQFCEMKFDGCQSFLIGAVSLSSEEISYICAT